VPRHQAKAVEFTFNASTDKVASASCHPQAMSGDEQVEDYYGGLVSAYSYAGTGQRRAMIARLEDKHLVPALRTDGSAGTAATCQKTPPHTWVADTPTAGTTAFGWTVTLDGGTPFQVNYGSGSDTSGSTGNLMTSVTCP
jgi:hypothetical protein